MQTQRSIRSWQQQVRRKLCEPAVRFWTQIMLSFLAGGCLSATALAAAAQPVCLGVLCAGLPGWTGLGFALGAAGGYGLFWGSTAGEGLVWLAAGLPVCVLLRQNRQSLLPPCLAALATAVSGLALQSRIEAGTAVYLLRIAVAFGTTCVAQLLWQKKRAGICLAVGIFVLSLARISLTQYLNLGLLAAGVLALTAEFPVVAVTGLALDISAVSPVPVTAALCAAYLLGKLPWRRLRPAMPALAYFAVMALCAQRHWQALPALALGGVAAGILTREPLREADRSEEQIRLEKMAQVLSQSRQLLQTVPVQPPDEGALLALAAQRACDGCARRTECCAVQHARYLPRLLLHQNGITTENMPVGCQEKERLLCQVQRSQDQYRLLLADRARQGEYRSAIMQQYGFLARFFRELADELPMQQQDRAVFRAEVAVCSRGREMANGDRCFWFAGTHERYYVLLCDGMGTGEAAAYEARTAGSLLRRMLTAGYSAHGAMQSINSLCALRGYAGAVTVDLAEIDLRSGRTTLYKWGAAPSWHIGTEGVQRLGRECPPPGLSLQENREMVERCFLLPGAVLVLLSDGVDGEAAINELRGQYDQPPGFLAALLLEAGTARVPDDATAAVVRLHRL